MIGNKGVEAKGTKSSTKSKPLAGTRDIPVPDKLLPVLKTLCDDKQLSDLLFPKEDGQNASKQATKFWWKSFLRQCHIVSGASLYRNAVEVETSRFGNEVTPHFLRHSYATDLYAAGVDQVAQKHFLGHSSNDVTDIYRKMNETAFDRALKLMNEYYDTMDYSIIPKEEISP